jgi:hypothetical protein
MPRALPCLLVAAALLAGPSAAVGKGPLAEPDDGPDPRGLTLEGSGLAYVTAPAHLSETSIRRAVAAARPHAVARAVGQARVRAQALATAAGLTLGEVQAVTERDQAAELGFPGDEQYCARRARPRCRVPLFAGAAVRATFATAETSATVAAGRALVASGTGEAAVRPRGRRDSASIRRALLEGRVAAAPLALDEARIDAAQVGAAAGLTLGGVFSIAEIRRPYDDPYVQGSFGPGRYCGTINRTIYRRDPATGRRRAVRRVRERRCFFSTRTTVALRVTYLPAAQ